MITASLNDSYKLMNTQGDNSLLMDNNYTTTNNVGLLDTVPGMNRVE